VLEAARTNMTILLDGRTDEPTWLEARWSEPFVDISGADSLIPPFETRVAMAWNDTALFLAARIEEPHVWGTLTERDAVIYRDNDFEFFFDPDGDNHRYGEVEINAMNAVWDLLLEKPYRDGGPAISTWNIDGLQHRVHVDGTLNDPADRDAGWSVEMCIPWRGIRDLSPARLPPVPGERWRVNFSRVQWASRDSSGLYVKTSSREDNWVWSPIGPVNMHLPERWGEVVFSDEVGSADSDVRWEEEKGRRALMEAYTAQRAFQKSNGRWALSVEELFRWNQRPLDDGIRMELSSGIPLMTIRVERKNGGKTLTVTTDGRLGVQ